MQLYEVSFKIEHEESFELGKIIVNGEDQNDAVKRVIYYCDLYDFAQNISFKVQKLKPQCYQISRQPVPKEKPAPKVITYESIVASLSGTPETVQVKTVKKFKQAYLIAIAAEVFCESQPIALDIIRHHIGNYAKNPKLKDTRVPVFEVECEEKSTLTQGLQQPYIDKQSIYTATRIFRG